MTSWNPFPSTGLLPVIFSLFLLGFASLSTPLYHHHHGKESCDEYDSDMATLGGLRESLGGAAENSVDIGSLGRFAVEEHNKKENALLEFERVVKAQEQVVAGKLYHLSIEAIEIGKKKLYEAQVWVKPWMNFKELQEFKHAGDVPSLTPSDIGAMRGDPPQGLKEVPVHDPEVQNAANHAMKTIQQRSNSLFPFELQEVTHARAEVLDEAARFHLVLKVKRGNKEENFNVEVHKKKDGNFHLNQMDNYGPSETSS